MKDFLYMQVPTAHGHHLISRMRGSSKIVCSPKGQPKSGRQALWRHHDDGTLELGGVSGLFLGTDQHGRLTLHHKRHSAADTWKVDAHGRLIHQPTGKPVQLDSANASFALADDQSLTPAQAYVEQLGQVIENILNPTPPAAPGYPTFTGTQAAAYQWIEGQLGLTSGQDLRQQYVKTGVDLGKYQTRLLALAAPSGQSFSATDFQTVKSALDGELGAALDVWKTLDTTKNFWKEVFSGTSSYLTALQTDLTDASKAAPTTNLAIATVFVQILYAAFSLFDTPGGFIANVMAGAFNSIVAFKSQGGDGSPMTFSKMQDALLLQNTQVVTELSKQCTTILGNAQMSKALSAYADANSPDGTQLQDAQNAAQYSYLMAILQNVLPGMCRLNVSPFVKSTSKAPSSVPSYNSYVYTSSQGSFLFWIDMYTSLLNNGQQLPQLVTQLMCDGPLAQSAGVSGKQFFLGLDGWSWQILDYQGDDYDGNNLLISLANSSSASISVEASAKQGDLIVPKPPKGAHKATITIAPDEVGYFVGEYDSGLEIKLTATAGSVQAVQFDCHQKERAIVQTPWVDTPIALGSGFAMSAPYCSGKSRVSGHNPGFIVATLTNG
jgi:hypothetical protein